TLRREPVLPSSDTTELPTALGFVQYHTVKVRRLKAATLERLVTHLLDGEHRELDFMPVFLSTYRAFTSTNLLIPPLSLLSTLVPVIRLWLEEHSEDFHEPPQYRALRLLCVHLHRRLCFRRLAQNAEVLLKKLQEQKDDNESSEQEIRDQHDGGEWATQEENKFDFMDSPVRDVAEQLTRLDAELFVKVVPFHCLGCIWSQRDKKENRNLAPTVRATISQFNAITNRVITSLLCLPALRARIIERWIAIAQDCRQLKNFSSLRAILSALQSNAVYRLKKTWAAVSRSANVFSMLHMFRIENTDFFIAIIEIHVLFCLQSLSSGIVPYLGTYLTVLTMLDTALTDTVEGGLINFEKRRREFEILSQIRQLQASCSHYNLPVNPHITSWLQAHTLLTDQESYELSRELEPPVDPCPASPNSWSSRLLTKKLASLQTPVFNIRSCGGQQGCKYVHILFFQSLSGSLHNVTEDFSSMSSSSSCSSSHPDLSSSSLVLSPESSSSCSPQAVLPVYNKQVADSCIVRVSVESVSNGNVYKSILLTSQDHTPRVIQRALEKHNMEDVSSNDFRLCQMLNNGKELQIPDKANVFYAMCTTANYDFVLRQRWKSHGRHLGSSSSPGAQPKSRHAK
uniref:Ral guanine nucleotide dissociation stimulator-like 3a n=1 Tax=Acanthochromis polyacanthus TaxID=80966 RepID=A0A3Q1FC61_9TELE